MDTPDSMKAELGAWNNGAGIDLETWIGCEGRLSLAVGYCTIFWPEFVVFERYVLIKGFHEAGLRSFERNPNATRESVEAVMNHVHIEDIHAVKDDSSRDKIVFLGSVLKQIYEAKLRWQFPDRTFSVEFFAHEPHDLSDYQLTFWQTGQTL